MALRQLKSDEAHAFDHLVDALMGMGEHGVLPWLLKLRDMGFDYATIQRYALRKIKAIENKVVEEYDDGEDIIRAQPRLPFGADFDIVAEDPEVLKEYMHHAIWPRDTFHEQDLSSGIGDRLEVGMKMRRRKKNER